jgi:hypothetical protein
MVSKAEFDQFWATYPRKVGKQAARRQFFKIVESKETTFTQLMDGLRRYVAEGPIYRDWCHPTTWLWQHRWLEPAQWRRLGTAGPGNA